MTNKLILILSLIILTSCEEKGVNIPAGYKCANYGFNSKCKSNDYLFKEKCNKDKIAKFIIDCAKAANPMSDEEGEDLVAECRKTGIQLFCEITFGIQND